MANPTSNFGWQMPTNTDLVKDLPADFEVFGQAVDTDLADLKGGTTGQVLSKTSNTDLDFTWTTPNVGDITEVQAGTGISVASGTGPIPVITNTVATEFDAKGDLVVGTGADTFDNLPVGTNGYYLSADSAETTGLKWVAAPAGGSMTELASQTFSNTASHTFTSISGSYKALALLLRSVRSTTNEQPIRIRFNSDTGTSYNQSAWTDSGSVTLANTGITVLRDPRQSYATTLGWTYIMDYANAVTHKMAEIRAVQSSTGGGGGYVQYGQLGIWSGTGAITSITIYAASGNLEAGTAILYGVN